MFYHVVLPMQDETRLFRFGNTLLSVVLAELLVGDFSVICSMATVFTLPPPVHSVADLFIFSVGSVLIISLNLSCFITF